jgi:hypothetical protein
MSHHRHRGRVVAWLVAASACGAAVAAGTAAESSERAIPADRSAALAAGARRPRRIDVRADLRVTGTPVADDLIGLSIEWPVLARDLGPSGTPPPVLVDALRALGRPPLRIGGDSQDRMWPVAGRMPAGAVWAPTPAFWAGLGRLDAAAGGMVEVGLDLAHADPAAARAVAVSAAGALPPGRATFSLGNEPDRYGIQGWARIRGRATTARPASWSFRAYLREYRDVRAGLGAIGTLQGPDYADPRWGGDLAAFVAAARPRAITVHAYPLTVCGKRRGAKSWPTGRRLLARSSWTGEVRRQLAWPLRAARRAHLPLVVSETNSVACRGAAGVSDGPAAGLWAPAFLLAAAHAGVRRLDVHASGSVYDPFRVVRGPDGAVALEPSAVFDGLVFLHRALGAGAHLLPVRVVPAGAPAWAIRGSGGRIRILVENLDARRSAIARLAVPGTAGAATVSRLTVAGRDAAGHFRMAIDGRVLVDRAGRLVADGPATGTAIPVVRGRAHVVLPPLSAAVVSAGAGAPVVRSPAVGPTRGSAGRRAR